MPNYEGRVFWVRHGDRLVWIVLDLDVSQFADETQDSNKHSETFEKVEKDGVTVTGARVPAIGVSGLLLGGGLSLQSSEHGFSCMGVENYEVFAQIWL